MASLIKISSTFINLDRVLQVEDLFARTKEDKLIIHFDSAEQSLTLTGQDADDLRTWLNSIAINLHGANDPDAEG
ncbi:MAG: hypothetical protein ACLQGP_09265 [Isosphaeraceae bacterium]